MNTHLEYLRMGSGRAPSSGAAGSRGVSICGFESYCQIGHHRNCTNVYSRSLYKKKQISKTLQWESFYYRNTSVKPLFCAQHLLSHLTPTMTFQVGNDGVPPAKEESSDSQVSAIATLGLSSRSWEVSKCSF